VIVYTSIWTSFDLFLEKFAGVPFSVRLYLVILKFNLKILWGLFPRASCSIVLGQERMNFDISKLVYCFMGIASVIFSSLQRSWVYPSIDVFFLSFYYSAGDVPYFRSLNRPIFQVIPVDQRRFEGISTFHNWGYCIVPTSPVSLCLELDQAA